MHHDIVLPRTTPSLAAQHDLAEEVAVHAALVPVVQLHAQRVRFRAELAREREPARGPARLLGVLLDVRAPDELVVPVDLRVGVRGARVVDFLPVPQAVGGSEATRGDDAQRAREDGGRG